MKLKYQVALALLRAGWSMADVLRYLKDFSIYAAYPNPLQAQQTSMFSLYCQAVEMRHSHTPNVWARMWAMATCARRVVGI